MKTILFVFVTVSIFTLNCGAGEPIAVDKLPHKIERYVKAHFPEQKIARAEIDRDGFSVTYEIVLDNRVELDFNKRSQLIEIDGKSKLPDSTIPSKILSYVRSNYSSNYITYWKFDDNKQEIELDNGLEIEFNRRGNFLRIDN